MELHDHLIVLLCIINRGKVFGKENFQTLIKANQFVLRVAHVQIAHCLQLMKAGS